MCEDRRRQDRQWTFTGHKREKVTISERGENGLTGSRQSWILVQAQGLQAEKVQTAAPTPLEPHTGVIPVKNKVQTKSAESFERTSAVTHVACLGSPARVNK